VFLGTTRICNLRHGSNSRALMPPTGFERPTSPNLVPTVGGPGHCNPRPRASRRTRRCFEVAYCKACGEIANRTWVEVNILVILLEELTTFHAAGNLVDINYFDAEISENTKIHNVSHSCILIVCRYIGMGKGDLKVITDNLDRLRLCHTLSALATGQRIVTEQKQCSYA